MKAAVSLFSAHLISLNAVILSNVTSLNLLIISKNISMEILTLAL